MLLRLSFGSGLALAAALSLPGQALTPASSPATQLPEVVVTPTRLDSDAFDVPHSVQRLDRFDLRERLQARTVPEALRELTAVLVQKTAHGQGSPFIRGFTGFRTLMLIDGVRLNNSTFREGPNQYWATIDPFTLGSLEVVKGPASVLYGSDAIGGTVNARSVSLAGAATAPLEGRFNYRYSSAEHSHAGRAEVTGRLGERVAAQVGWSQKRYGDLRAGEDLGLQPKTGYDEAAGDVRVEYAVGEHARLIAAYQTLEQDDAWRTHRTIYGRPWRGTTIGNDLELSLDQARDLAYLHYRHERIAGPVDALQVTLSHHRQEETEQRIRNNRQLDLQGYEVDSTGLSLQLHSQTRVGRWVYGAEYYRDQVDSYRRSYRPDGTLNAIGIQGQVGDDARYELLGLYAQDLVRLTDRTDAIVGVRYNRAEADADRVQSPVTAAAIEVNGSWDATVGSARILHRLDTQRRWHAFAGVSQGFRAPNLSDLTRLDIARSGELEVPSPGLEPEYFTSFETGLKMQLSRASAQLAVFHTRITDMIDRFPADNPATPGVIEVLKANVGNGHVNGVELAAEAEPAPGWTIWANLTAMRGEVDAVITTVPRRIERRPLTRVMPLTSRVGVRHAGGNGRWWTGVDAAFVAKQDRLSPGDVLDTQRIPPGGTPGYTVFNFRAGTRLTQAFSLSAAVENIGDVTYRVHGSGLNEPGRNLVVSGELRF